MKWTIDKLSILVGFLSLVVLLQSIYIMKGLDERKERLSEMAVQQMDPELEAMIKSDSIQEADEFKNFQNKSDVASLRLEKVECSECENESVEIWLSADTFVNSADVKIFYFEDEANIVDQIDDVDGIQIGFGDADLYLNNNVEGEVISLSASFEEGFVGDIKLGTIVFDRVGENSADFVFDYTENLLDGSYVLDMESDKNILINPDSYIF